MADLTYTDAAGVEQGVIPRFALDLAYGDDENDFELTVPPEYARKLGDGCLVYLDGTGYGGVVDGGCESALGDAPSYKARGRDWHGVLAERYLVPDGDYVEVQGDANECIAAVLSATGLEEVFSVPAEPCGVQVSHRFERFASAWEGLRKMLRAAGLRLQVLKEPGGRPRLSAVPARFYGDVDGERRCAYEASWSRPVNHIVCAGSGELSERAVVHLYADGDGNVGGVQSIFGLGERQYLYEYTTDDEAELRADGAKKLAELQSAGELNVELPEDAGLDVGDEAGVTVEGTGAEVRAEVVKVVVSADGDGQLSVSCELGEPRWKED